MTELVRPRYRVSNLIDVHFHLGISFITLTIAAMNGGLYWLLLWPVTSSSVVSLACFFKMPQLLGKMSDGHFAQWSLVLLFPYFFWIWCAWWSWKFFSREPTWVQIHESLVIGARPCRHELLGDINVIVDLTAELPRVNGRSGFQYESIPILDGTTPSLLQLEIYVEAIHSIPGRRYIHCAQGNDRTGLIATALLIREKRVFSKRSAVEEVHALRPSVDLNPDQLSILVKYSHFLRQRREENEIIPDEQSPPSPPESAVPRFGDTPS